MYSICVIFTAPAYTSTVPFSQSYGWGAGIASSTAPLDLPPVPIPMVSINTATGEKYQDRKKRREMGSSEIQASCSGLRGKLVGLI